MSENQRENQAVDSSADEYNTCCEYNLQRCARQPRRHRDREASSAAAAGPPPRSRPIHQRNLRGYVDSVTFWDPWTPLAKRNLSPGRAGSKGSQKVTVTTYPLKLSVSTHICCWLYNRRRCGQLSQLYFRLSRLLLKTSLVLSVTQIERKFVVTS